MKIQELNDGYKGSITVLITNLNRGVTAKGAPYLSFTYQDKTGTMEAKYWNVKEEEIDLYIPRASSRGAPPAHRGAARPGRRRSARCERRHPGAP